MKLFGFLIVALLASAPTFAYLPEPSRPVITDSVITPLFKRAAYAAFLGDACSINHTIAQKVRNISKISYSSDSKKQQERIAAFGRQKSFFSSNASAVGILKRCTIESGKTKSFIGDVSLELDDITQNYSTQLSDYNAAYYEWKQDVIREREAEYRREAERQAAEKAAYDEKIRSKAFKYADQLGRLVVSRAYQGGSSIGVTLVSYEYINSASTMRMKVEIRWNGAASGESGYAADGEILAIEDSSPTWEYGKNLKWNPTYQSQKLNVYISNRQGAAVAAGILGAIAGNSH